MKDVHELKLERRHLMFHGRSNIILFALAVIAGVLLMGSGETVAQQTTPGGGATMEAARISPQDAYQQVTSGKTLLVCAYQSEQICKEIMLKGGISLQEFEQKLPNLKKDQPIIFFCQ
jgi:hypothetical protein